MSSLTPIEIVHKMLDKDAFSALLEMKIVSVEEDEVSLRMKVTSKMLNGFDIAHGGITYALADSCVAFAANCGGKKWVSVETSISHLRPLKENDIVSANAKLVSKSSNVATYIVELSNQRTQAVAHFKGTMYNTGETW